MCACVREREEEASAAHDADLHAHVLLSSRRHTASARVVSSSQVYAAAAAGEPTVSGTGGTGEWQRQEGRGKTQGERTGGWRVKRNGGRSGKPGEGRTEGAKGRGVGAFGRKGLPRVERIAASRSQASAAFSCVPRSQLPTLRPMLSRRQKVADDRHLVLSTVTTSCVPGSLRSLPSLL